MFHTVNGASRIVLQLVIVLLLVGQLAVAGCGDQSSSSGGRKRASSAEQRKAARLFEKCKKKGNRKQQDRVEAASSLVKTDEGEKWAILILLSKTALDWGCEEKGGVDVNSTERSVDKGVVARLLENVPSDASHALLWAITYKLDDKEGGLFSEVDGVIVGARIDGMTEPIRELARKALVRAMGVDHSYDHAAWRKAILERVSSDLRQ